MIANQSFMSLSTVDQTLLKLAGSVSGATARACAGSMRFRRDLQLTSDFDTLISVRGVPRKHVALVFLHINYLSHKRSTEVPQGKCTMPFFFDTRRSIRHLVRMLKIHCSRAHDFRRQSIFAGYTRKNPNDPNTPTCCISTDVTHWFFADRKTQFPLIPRHSLANSPVDYSNLPFEGDLTQQPDGCLAAGLELSSSLSESDQKRLKCCVFELPVNISIDPPKELSFEPIDENNIDDLCDVYRQCSHRQGMCSSVARQTLACYPPELKSEMMHASDINAKNTYLCRCEVCRHAAHKLIASLNVNCEAKSSDHCCCAFPAYLRDNCSHVLHLDTVIESDDYFYDAIGDRIYLPPSKKGDDGIFSAMSVAERFDITKDYACARAMSKLFLPAQKPDPVLTRPVDLQGLSYQQFLNYFREKFNKPEGESIAHIIAPEMLRKTYYSDAVASTMEWAPPFAKHFLATVIGVPSVVKKNFKGMLAICPKMLTDSLERLIFAELVREKNRRIALGRICTGRIGLVYDLENHDQCIVHLWVICFVIRAMEHEAPVIRAEEDAKHQRSLDEIKVAVDLLPAPKAVVSNKNKQQQRRKKPARDLPKKIVKPVEPKRELVVPRVPPSKIRMREDLYISYSDPPSAKKNEQQLVLAPQLPPLQSLAPAQVIQVSQTQVSVVTVAISDIHPAIENLCVAFERAFGRHYGRSTEIREPRPIGSGAMRCLEWNVLCAL